MYMIAESATRDPGSTNSTLLPPARHESRIGTPLADAWLHIYMDAHTRHVLLRACRSLDRAENMGHTRRFLTCLVLGMELARRRSFDIHAKCRLQHDSSPDLASPLQADVRYPEVSVKRMQQQNNRYRYTTGSRSKARKRQHIDHPGSSFPLQLDLKNSVVILI